MDSFEQKKPGAGTNERPKDTQEDLGSNSEARAAIANAAESVAEVGYEPPDAVGAFVSNCEPFLDEGYTEFGEVHLEVRKAVNRPGRYPWDARARKDRAVARQRFQTSARFVEGDRCSSRPQAASAH